MRESVGSFIGSNRVSFSLLGIVLGLALLGFAGWAQIRQAGGAIAAVYWDDSAKGHSVNGKPKKRDNPAARAEWFMHPRRYPFEKVPDGARRRASDEVKARGESMSGEGAAGAWTSIGPVPTAGAGPGGNVSGRINEIAVSPADTQIILVAGSTGGIWRSTDGGTSFVPVSDSEVDVAVGAIAFAPGAPNIVYAGMGDNDNGYFGTGVLKSTDSGATWRRINNNSLPPRAQSTSIHVDPSDPNKVYLTHFNSLDTANCTSRPCAGVVGGVYISTDGGVSWTRTLTGNASDLAIHPTNPQIIYAALRFGASNSDPRGLFKSTDGGTTWNNVFASPYANEQDSTKDFRVAVTPAAPQRVYIYFGSDGPPAEVRLEMSDDGGTTFTSRGVVGTSSTGLDPGQFGYNTFLEAHPTDANTIYVGSRDVFRSTDGGATFTNLNNSFRPPYTCDACFTEGNQKMHTDQQCFAFMPGTPSTWFAGNDGGIFKTTNDGETFTSLNQTLSLVQFIGIAMHPTDGSRSYAGAQDNGSQRRVDGGRGWTEFVGGDGGNVAINPLDPTMVFPSNTEGSISRVLNNGTTNTASIAAAASFEETASPVRVGFYPPVVSNGVDARVYSGSWRLFICSDCNDTNREQGTSNSTTWTAPGGMTDLTTGGSDVLSAIAVARSDTDVIYTGSRDGRAMRSTDGGANWSNITAGLPQRGIGNITVSRIDPTRVYLTVLGYGTAHVFSSTNSGTNWTAISNGLPDIPTSGFLIDPLNANTLYAGTDIGVFRSTDNGANWSAFNNGLPPTPVMGFTSQATGRIQLTTYGRGSYELTTGGPGPTPTPTPNVTPTPTPNVTPTPTSTPPGIRATAFDYDADGRADISIFRESVGDWYLQGSTAGFSAFRFGLVTDRIVPADYDGDRRTDIAVYRASLGTWFILNTTDLTVSSVQFGLSDDLPTPADFDGDGKADIGIYRPSSGTWFRNNSSNGQFVAFPFGVAGDKPVPQDFDGDGRADYGIYRPSNGIWFQQLSATNTFFGEGFGAVGDTIVPGDYDGDRKADLAVYRASAATWFIKSSITGGFAATAFGAPTDQPAPADYDGDGRFDICVFRASEGQWFRLNSSNGAFNAFPFGVSGDRATPTAFQ